MTQATMSTLARSAPRRGRGRRPPDRLEADWSPVRRGQLGRATTITVPVLSRSGSWLTAGSYVQPDFAAAVTLNVTLATEERDSFAFCTVQAPFVPVVQEAEPLAPALQLPVTTTPPTAPWAASWIRIVTLAVQVLPDAEAERSRSPTWSVLAGGGGVRP